jgi:tetratricopeptide (TPR) repeat protein
MPSEFDLPLEAETLNSPRGFEGWWEQTVQHQWSNEQRLAAILAVDSPLAKVRASHVYADLEDFENWALAAGEGLLADDTATRCLATARLGLHEVIQATYHTGKGAASGGTVAIPILERAITEILKVHEQAPLILEALFRLHRGLANAFKQTGQDQAAISEAAEAIKYAKALGLKGGLQAVIQLLGSMYFEAGKTELALAEYDLLVKSPDINQNVLTYALINRALLLLMLGDDEAAMRSLEDASTNKRIQACRQYILCSAGRGGTEGEILGGLEGMPVEFGFHTTCYRLLLAHDGQPKTEDLQRVVQVAQDFRPSTTYATVMQAWFLGQALLGQGHAVTAAINVRNMPWRELPTHYYAARGRSLMLWLEIGLHYGSEDLAPLVRLTSEIRKLFNQISNPSTRSSLARCLTLWHPTAAAFVAYSPDSVPEFFQFATPAVWRDARPIFVYGEGVTTRTPFVAKALRDFGFRTEDREGGTEEAKLLTVLRKPHTREGERLHIRPIISPALLVYNLIRADDASDSLWRRAAFDLARSHGLIPVPQTRNYHSREVEYVNNRLEKLLKGEVSPLGFRAEIRGTS